MQFADIIGHQSVIEHFRRMVRLNRISHAQLLAGEEGIGKLALALAFAQYISCTNRTEEDSCGTCSSCVKYQKLIHPDLHFVFPVARTKKVSKPISDDFIGDWRKMLTNNYSFTLNSWLENIGAENAQGSIYVHESQQIIRKLNLKTFESDYKIMIIYRPEKMNTVTANKLLKMIEEPPPKTVFLLVAENPEQVLGTIFSRSQLIKIPKIDKQELINSLVNRDHLSSEQAAITAKLANGNYLKAREVIQASESNQRNYELFVRLMRLCYVAPKDNSKIVVLTKWVDEAALLGREKQKDFLKYALRLVRENLAVNLVNSTESDIVYLANDEKTFSEKFSKFINPANAQQIYFEFNTAFTDIERNGAAKIVLMDMALKLVKLLRLTPVINPK